jgi:hypothetical protein
VSISCWSRPGIGGKSILSIPIWLFSGLLKTAAVDHFTTDDQVMITHVPQKGTTTLYALINDLFAWLNILTLLLTLAYHLVVIREQLITS